MPSYDPDVVARLILELRKSVARLETLSRLDENALISFRLQKR